MKKIILLIALVLTTCSCFGMSQTITLYSGGTGFGDNEKYTEDVGKYVTTSGKSIWMPKWITKTRWVEDQVTVTKTYPDHLDKSQAIYSHEGFYFTYEILIPSLELTDYPSRYENSNTVVLVDKGMITGVWLEGTWYTYDVVKKIVGILKREYKKDFDAETKKAAEEQSRQISIQIMKNIFKLLSEADPAYPVPVYIDTEGNTGVTILSPVDLEGDDFALYWEGTTITAVNDPVIESLERVADFWALHDKTFQQEYADFLSNTFNTKQPELPVGRVADIIAPLIQKRLAELREPGLDK